MNLIEQIKGHDSILACLSLAIQKNQLAHALLFSGPSGVGKKQTAIALSQSLLCKEKTSPAACGKCQSCSLVSKGQSESVFFVRHETLQIRLEDVRPVIPFLSLEGFAPAKVVIIDSAEKLNIQAGNFLLKIIEEPPPNSFFFLISANQARLPATLRSRIQNVSFSVLPESLIKALAPADTEQWMIKACGGRPGRLKELKEDGALREEAFQLWSEVFSHTSPSEIDFKNKIKDRKTALTIGRFWLELLRDARLYHLTGKRQLIHADKEQTIAKTSQIPSMILNEWIKSTGRLESDLQANADISLCFEHWAGGVQDGLQVCA